MYHYTLCPSAKPDLKYNLFWSYLGKTTYYCGCAVFRFVKLTKTIQPTQIRLLPYSPMWRHRHLFQSLKVFITTKCCKGYIWYIVLKHFVILYIICYSSWFPKGPFGCDFWRGGFNIWKGQISQVKSVKFCIFVTYSFSSFHCYFRFHNIQFLILLQAFSISACMYVISGSSMFYQPPHHQPQRWMRRPLHISTRDKHMIWKLKR